MSPSEKCTQSSTVSDCTTNNPEIEIHVAEFYSGIGGTRMAIELIEAFIEQFYTKKTVNEELSFVIPNKITFSWIGAFDINENANILYKHLFSHDPCAKDIAHIPICDFQRQYFKRFLEKRNEQNSTTSFSFENSKKKQKLSEDHSQKCSKLLWTMSPPCQPFTLNGNRKDSEDDRTKSFLYLMSELFPKILPDYIFVENVKNFEISKTRQHLVNQLTNHGYQFKEFMLCPTQLGLPNQRVRYYLIGQRVDFNIENAINITETSELKDVKLDLHTSLPEYMFSKSGNNETRPLLDYDRVFNNPEKVEQLQKQGKAATFMDLYNHSSILLTSEEEKIYENDMIFVEQKHLSKIKGYRYDLILKKSNHSKDTPPLKRVCSCITKSYGQTQFLRGTGPLVVLLSDTYLNADLETTLHSIDFDNVQSLTELGRIRFLHPIEVARLMTFSPWFSCPSSKLSIKQQYKLMGNSVNVLSVANVIIQLFLEEKAKGSN
ncbi:hypothetical protein C9374_005419 [Naegleria lovaniensis]|uniref:Uncharacterized protein n=1 Tax=Naegleria lovaniensis TaxID=51637 RepID=A0AA88KIH7_NAELO|nr:uncharacterized protein C9374_005419 [Naegleria lovaniensis]KAG2382217.1 hypothetical protein C9374_005419 [Naegleria lovaniensis]